MCHKHGPDNGKKLSSRRLCLNSIRAILQICSSCTSKSRRASPQTLCQTCISYAVLTLLTLNGSCREGASKVLQYSKLSEFIFFLLKYCPHQREKSVTICIVHVLGALSHGDLLREGSLSLRNIGLDNPRSTRLSSTPIPSPWT
jgi:hypothetical protein